MPRHHEIDEVNSAMLKGIDHVNLVVDNIQAMTRFYTQVLGLKIAKEVTIEGPWVQQVVNLPDVKAHVVYLEADQGPRIELIQYVNPIAKRAEGIDMANAPGIRHLAFRVEDIDEVTSNLQRAGLGTLSPVQQVPDTQVTYTGGVRKRLVYFRDPEGNLLELCEYR